MESLKSVRPDMQLLEDYPDYIELIDLLMSKVLLLKNVSHHSKDKACELQPHGRVKS
jgi:hypothetical protein